MNSLVWNNVFEPTPMINNNISLDDISYHPWIRFIFMNECDKEMCIEFPQFSNVHDYVFYDS